MKGLQIEKTGGSASTVGHIGSVADVIAARLPPKITSRRFKAADFAYGFELATPKEISSLGEAILLNGTCYTTSTESSSSDRMIYGPDFVTGGIFLIPHGAKPSYKARFNDPVSVPLLDCYNALYQTIQMPFTFVGLIEFDTFHATAIEAPPIDGRNIFENKSHYYPHPDIQTKGAFGFVMGAMTNYKLPQFASINKQLEVVLYNNPTEKSSVLTYHAHILTLKHKVDSISQVVPSMANQVLHLFCEGSNVKSLQFDIFTIQQMENYL